MSNEAPTIDSLAVYEMPTGRRLWAYRRFDGTWGKAPTFARAARYWAWEQHRLEQAILNPCDGNWGTGRPLGMTHPDTWTQTCSGCKERLIIRNGRAYHFPPDTTDAEIWESL